jgi:RNA polymerase II subunit A C-terminal domain phosphatase SSU72
MLSERCFLTHFIRYTQNGLLHTLDRNRRIKSHPERFQETDEKFDILITCEERVYDQVVEFMDSKTPTDNSIVHVINIDIQDNLEEATIGAFLISDMCLMLAKAEDLDNDIEEVLHNFEEKCQRPILHSIVFN